MNFTNIELSRSILSSDPHKFLDTLRSKKINNIILTYNNIYSHNYEINQFMLNLYLVWKQDYQDILIKNFYEISKIIDGEELELSTYINPKCYTCEISKYCTIKNNNDYRNKFDYTGCPGLTTLIRYILRNL